MKNNKALIVAGIILLNILVIYMLGQNLLGKSSQYEQTVAQARTYAKQELCSKSIEKYNEAILTKDTLELRLEMIDVYQKGIEIGEFTSLYDICADITSMVDKYSKEPVIYESACDIFLKYEKYEECASILMQARDFNVTSDKIEDARSKVRYQYTMYFGMYTEILPVFNEMYTVKAEDAYSFLNDEASPDLDGGYTYATSFSEGYAFVKTASSEKDKKGFVINKDGERQFYIENVEESSGIGKAKDQNGDDILLLACKIGDKYCYYDINGNKVLDGYTFAGRFRNNIAAVKDENGKWKLIDGTGEAITDKVFSDVVLNEFDECAPKGLIIAKEGKEYHIYDMEIKQIGDFACDGAKAFVDDYAAFKSGDLWGFVSAEGEIIIEPQYEDAKSFSNSMGAVKISGTWNFISPKNEVVIYETFEDVDYLNDKGYCFVKKDGYWSYIKMYYTGK